MFCPDCGKQTPDIRNFCINCGADLRSIDGKKPAGLVAQDQREPSAGGEYDFTHREILGYKIVGELGRGGMGIVYLGENPLLEKKVAIKALSPALTNDQRFRQRFFKEAKSQFELKHPNITQIENFQEYQGNYCLVMEYVPGDTLAELIQLKGCLGEREALAIFKQVLKGLNYAHNKGVIHRDIKPSNIKVTPEGEVKIMDFGIALMVGDKRLTRTGTTIGTPEYMSPEQITKPKNMDHRSDIYSTGIVLYEMLTGDVPFKSETDSDYEIKDQQVHAAPPDPRLKNSMISPTLAQIILKALEKEPGARYSTCGEFMRIIEVYEIGEPEDSEPDVAESVKRAKPVEGKKPVVPEKVARKKSSKGMMLALMIGMFIVFTVGLLWLGESQRKQAADRTRIAQEQQKQTGEDASGRDDTAYQQAVNINTKAAYMEYLRLYPQGRRAVEAGAKVREMEELEAARQKVEQARQETSRTEEARRAEEAARAELERSSPLGIRLVRIPGGNFMMGSENGESDEKPVHQVTVSGFEMSATEITVSRFRVFVEKTGYVTEAEKVGWSYGWDGSKWIQKQGVNWRSPGFAQGDDEPVICVSWNDAVEFCRWLSRETGDNFRLPTEAEWEYACRAGTTTKYYTGDSESDLSRAGWYSGNSGGRTHPAGQKEANAFGLYDLHGNVWEWCQDWYDSNYYSGSPSQNPAGPSSSSRRVLRGGSWNYDADYCSSASRDNDSPGFNFNIVGFRVARR